MADRLLLLLLLGSLINLGEAMLTIRGKIKFSADSAPKIIPDGSTLTVKFQDTSMMDAPAIELGTSVQTITGYDGGVLTFEIKNAKKPNFPEASISAVLNHGWTPSGDEWIRQGDYFNDTHHSVRIKENDTIYNDCDVDVIHYKSKPHHNNSQFFDIVSGWVYLLGISPTKTQCV